MAERNASRKAVFFCYHGRAGKKYPFRGSRKHSLAENVGWCGTRSVERAIFGLPDNVDHLLPSHIVGILSLLILALAIPARYVFHLAGAWRWIYVVGSAVALYFNVLVLIVQAFQKVPALKTLAPTQKEPPFVVAQLVALLVFATLTVFATVRFHPERVRTA